MSAASTREQRPLTQDDKVAAFRAATGVFVRKYTERFAAGMTEAELEAALKDSLSIFAGRCGPGQMHLTWQGAGLKIWASWRIHNHVQEAPIFAGKATIAMAREVYGIPDHGNPQLPCPDTSASRHAPRRRGLCYNSDYHARNCGVISDGPFKTHLDRP